MQLHRRSGFESCVFHSPTEALAVIERDGFNWRLVREYFQFTDAWLSEGEYDCLLEAALRSIDSNEGQNTLLDMLDLQYAVFLEQVALQERMLGISACEDESVAFGERVMAYLQINSNHRPDSTRWRKSARSALLETPPGQLIQRLLGAVDQPIAASQLKHQDLEG